MKTIYISKSIHLREDYVDEAFRYLEEEQFNYLYWNKYQPYNTVKLEKSDALVILVNPNDTGCIGKGTYSEIEVAKAKGIPVYIIYQRKSDFTFQFYKLYTYEIAQKEDYNKYGLIVFGANVTSEFKDSYINYDLPENAFDYLMEDLPEFEEDFIDSINLCSDDELFDETLLLLR